MTNRLFILYLTLTCLAGATLRTSEAQETEKKLYPVLSGVGLALKARDGHLYVGKVVPKSPAEKSGQIREGARLLSIETNGKKTSLDGMTVGDAASLVRGPVGTEIVLTIIPAKDAAPLKISLTRKALEFPGVPESTYKAFIGKPAPDLTLTGINGEKVRQLADYQGKIVVLDFWASWCPTCFAPVSKLQPMVANHPEWTDKVEVLAVTVDSDLSKARGVVDKKKWTSTQHRATDVEKLNSLGISTIPVVIVISPDGKVASMSDAHAIEIEKEVTSLLKK